MNASTVTAAASLVRSKIGIAVVGEVCREGDTDCLELWPADLPPNNGFRVLLKPGWRSADVVVEMGNYSGAILRSIANASEEAKLTFEAFIAALRKGGLQVKFTFDGIEVDSATSWPGQITSLDFAVRQRAIVFDHTSDTDLLALVDRMMVPVFGILASLIGVEEIDLETEGVSEGKPYQTLLTRYERKRVNREACLRVHQPVCAACGFDFGKFYGPVGQDFIEVHHVESLADVGEEHPIDPAKDLVPLCANCHAMAHRQRPAYSVEQLKGMIAGSAQ